MTDVAPTEPGRPNIVMIVTDGLADLPGEVSTRLTDEGRSLGTLQTTGSTSATVWTSLLTGLPPAALGLSLDHGEGDGRAAHDGLRGVPVAGVRAFPELLRRVGYYTVRSGDVRHNLSSVAGASVPVSGRGETHRPAGLLGAWDAAGPELDWSREAGDPCAVAFGCGNYTGEHTGPFFVLLDLVGGVDLAQRVPQLLTKLESDGLADQTVLMWLGLDGASPVIVSGPPLAVGHVDGDPVARTVDVAPTLLTLAGAPVPDVMSGRDLLGTSDAGSVEPGRLVEGWTDGVTPVAATPQGYPTGGVFHIAPRVELSCDTPDATIVYTTELDPPYHWRLYTGPFRMRFWTLRFQCGRLGYADSPVVTYDFDIE